MLYLNNKISIKKTNEKQNIFYLIILKEKIINDGLCESIRISYSIEIDVFSGGNIWASVCY